MIAAVAMRLAMKLDGASAAYLEAVRRGDDAAAVRAAADGSDAYQRLISAAPWPVPAETTRVEVFAAVRVFLAVVYGFSVDDLPKTPADCRGITLTS